MSPDRRFLRLGSRTRRRIAADVDAELDLHLELRAARLQAQGMAPHEARLEAEREFGDLDFTRRYCTDLDARAERSMRAKEWTMELWQDLAYAARTLRRSRGYALVALATIAIAIGANTAIFSAASAALLQPLPYHDAGALVALYEDNTQTHESRSDMSAADLTDYRAMQHSFSGLAYIERPDRVTLRVAGEEPHVVNAMPVSADLFDVLRVGALRGRTFTSDEGTPAKRNVVILGYDLWQREFGGDTSVIGRTVNVFSRDRQVIGVMPRGFTLGYGDELWMPFDLSRVLASGPPARKMHFLFGIARLRPGVGIAAARADLGTAARQLEARYPDANTGHYVTVLSLRDAMVGDVRPALLLLLAAAGMVLLIACANLTNISLARAVTRRRELAVRTAIGAGRGRLVRQLLTESVLLAAAGGALGVAIAYPATHALLALNPNVLPAVARVSLDGRVLVFSTIIALAAGVLGGLAPALAGSRVDLQTALKDGGRASSAGSARLRSALVVAQVALAVILLVGAGLLARTFGALQRVQLGFDPARVLTAEISLSGDRYDSLAAFNRFWDGVLAGVQAAPGVRGAAFVSSLPLRGSSTSSLTVENEPVDPLHMPEVGYISVVGDYFRTMGIPLVAGRIFDATDLPRGPRSVIISESLARRFFPHGDALGRRIRLGPNPAEPFETIVGIVGDVRQLGLEMEPRAAAYVFNAQDPFNTLALVVRTTGDPKSATRAVREAVRAMDPLIAVADVRPMEDVMGASLSARRFSLALAMAFAAIALLLAAVGVYGVLAYTVTAEERELGIRLALGATARGILRLVLGRGMMLVGLGLAIGLALALSGGGLIRSLLYGVAPSDAATVAFVASALGAAGVLACAIPALRAMRVDPAAVMKDSG